MKVELLYRYVWGNNPKRAAMKGRVCRVLHSMKFQSLDVEFTDNGQREIVSRRALRRLQAPDSTDPSSP